MNQKPTYQELEQRVGALEQAESELLKTKEELRTLEAKFSGMFNAAPNSMAVTRMEDGVFVEVNQAFANAVSYSTEEIIGKNALDLGISFDLIYREHMKAEIQDRGRFKNLEVSVIGAGGRKLDGLLSGEVFSVNDEDFLLTVFVDMTNRKRAEEALKASQQRLSQIIDFLPDATMVIDLNGKVIAWNRAIEEMTGIKAEDILGKGDYEYAIPFYGERRPVLIDLVSRWDKQIKKKYQYVKKEGESLVSETYDPKVKPGGFLWNKASLLYDRNGNAIGAIESIRDISDMKHAQEALRESEEKFRLISEQSLMAILIVQDDRIKYANQAYLAMTGYTCEEIMNWTMGDSAQLIHPDDCHFVMEQGRKKAAGIRNGVVTHYSYRGVTKRGEVRWIDQYSKTIMHRGKPADLMMLIDIHDQKLAQETLRQSEKKYRELADSLPQIIFETDENGKLTFVNRNAFDLFGYSQRDFDRGANAIEMLIPEDRNTAMENMQRVMRGERLSGNEYTALRKDGSTFPVLIHSNTLVRENKFMGIRGIIIDLTQTKKAEEALRESEERYRALYDRSFELVYLCDFEGNFIDANDTALALLGYTKKDIRSLNFASLLSEDQLPLAFEMVKEILETGSQKEMIEYKLTLKDGEHIFVESKGAIIYREGKPYAIQGIARDITERKLAEEALRESEEKFSKLFFSSPTWMAITNVENETFLEVNKAFEDITGFDRKDVIGRTSLELGLLAEPSKRRQMIALALDKGGFREQEITFLTKNGNPISALWSAEIIELAGETCLLSTVMDITELKRSRDERTKLEEQLHRAQKMEAMGLLAGGVAHDLNNILSGIVSYPELILMDLPQDSPLRRPIQVIHESGMRAANVVADLLTIARGVTIRKEALSINTIVREYLNSAEFRELEKMRTFIDFKTDIASDLFNMKGSSLHIKKVLMNLVGNATEAIEKSGKVTISTRNQYLDEPLRGYEDIRRGEYVVLSVSDDGSGISSEDIGKIFEPFYTKKVMGRSGTGLGLAVVWNTIQDHNGYINVESSEKGTTFELYFPVSREEVAEKAEPIGLEEYLGHGEKILVVDDEETQKEIAVGILTKLGYHAEAVSSGTEAVARVKEHPVDLIVLDMVMPKGMNGRETYEEIIKIRPGQKAIIASGYAKTEEVDAAQKLGAGKYIKKPYTLERIGLAVKEELEK